MQYIIQLIFSIALDGVQGELVPKLGKATMTSPMTGMFETNIRKIDFKH